MVKCGVLFEVRTELLSIIQTSFGFSISGIVLIFCEPGSSVSIVSGYGLDDRAIEVRSPAEEKGFFL
jgi:hypothetical protein